MRKKRHAASQEKAQNINQNIGGGIMSKNRNIVNAHIDDPLANGT